MRDIASRLGVTDNAVKKRLKGDLARMGLKLPKLFKSPRLDGDLLLLIKKIDKKCVQMDLNHRPAG